MPIQKLTKSFLDFLLTLYRRRFLILEMAKRDIAQNQVGSLLGFIWTFINPLVLICILWIVFSIGFKTPTVTGVPFVVWLTAGLIVWNAFSESLNGATISVRTNPHLVKKILFPLSILPVVKLVASLMVHLVFILILIALILLHGLPGSFYWFQCVYYLGAMLIFVLGLSWLTSSLFVYIRDIGQVVAILLQFGFWATPIFWPLDYMPESVRIWFKLNPMFYVVQGYRESFLSFVPFWHHPTLTIYFWSVTAVMFVLGAIVFQRLRPSFTDLL
jgi:lipopolysaccharide transport system permease protein